MRNKKPAEQSPNTIGFRLDPEHGEVLATRAKRWESVPMNWRGVI